MNFDPFRFADENSIASRPSIDRSILIAYRWTDMLSSLPHSRDAIATAVPDDAAADLVEKRSISAVFPPLPYLFDMIKMLANRLFVEGK